MICKPKAPERGLFCVCIIACFSIGNQLESFPAYFFGNSGYSHILKILACFFDGNFLEKFARPIFGKSLLENS